AAGADTKAAGPFLSGQRSALDAQAKYDRGDFTNARTDWETATKYIQQAMGDAAKAVPAPPPAAPPPPALAPAQSTPTQTAAAQSNAAQKAAAQKGEDERAIQNVIDRYRTAYEARNLNGIRAVFPNIGGTEGTATATNIRQAKTIQLR